MLKGNNNEEKIWNYIFSKLKNAYGTAGIMGNMYAESGLNPINMENSYEKKYGFTDSSYTIAVDNGSYNNFVHDSVGYGLVQWTFWTLKQDLYNYAKSTNRSIGDLEMQLEFLCKQLSEQYIVVWNECKNAKNILDASNSMLLKFERPADQSAFVQKSRASFGQKYYDKYANKTNSNSEKLNFKNGNIIEFTGNQHYISSNDASAKICKSGKAKITNISIGSKHPYHIIATSGSNSNVYGWVDAKYIKPVTDTIKNNMSTSVNDKIDYASSFLSSLTGTYVTIDNLRLRTGASTNKPLLCIMNTGSKVQCYGYYSVAENGVKWYYVEFVDANGKRYVGFCSSNYLKKI